ncbi:MAG: glycosyltransferase family 4 protein [Rhodobacteraceae bacterium]|nr:glycosyltransferase family 4 protein [Paracoccaceae bacterium]
MRVAFYAPLKPAHHPKPSGDRTVARAILDVLRSLDGVTSVTVASDLQTREGVGDIEAQDRILQTADAHLNRLKAETFDAWVTYHTYYKAPDLLGPRFAVRKGIPYIQIEASRAPKRLVGPWARFARLAEAATDAADVVCYMTERDRPALAAGQPEGQTLLHLPPFLNREKLPLPKQPVPGARYLAVGMLRHGDKMASYQILANALEHVSDTDWTLDILGDGPARDDIEPMFSGFGAKVRFHGQVSAARVEDAIRRASCMLWPGVNEAFGMIYLEAQAPGLRVLAEDRPGVREVAGRAAHLTPTGSFGPAINALQDESVPDIHYARAFMKNRLRPAARRVLGKALGLV